MTEQDRLRRFDILIKTLGIRRTTAINILIEWAIQQNKLPSLEGPEDETKDVFS